MATDIFKSAGIDYEITVNPAPADGKKYAILTVLHGNWGLGEPFGSQIQRFAEDLATEEYLTAVPNYYTDNEPHLADQSLKDQILSDATADLAVRPNADADRLGLVGFSLGAATAMTYIAMHPAARVGVLADFYGFLTRSIRGGVANFPPTAMFHNKKDDIVDFEFSEELDRILSGRVDRKLWHYDKVFPPGNHAFRPDGKADVESRKEAKGWVMKYLLPEGV